jgi:haloalkane dehalogenase
MLETSIAQHELPQWFDSCMYHFAPHTFQTAAGKMHYIDQGQGEPVVFVHGNPGWSFEFRDVINGISIKRRCIAPDHIGFGLSDKPADWDYLPEQHAEHFNALMDALDLQGMTLVVSDWGGPIGLSYALRHPERIKRLVIINSWMWSVKDDGYYRMFSGLMGGAVGRFLTGNFNFFARAVVPMVYGKHRKLTREVHHFMSAPLASKAERKGAYVFPQQIIGSSDWLAQLWEQRAKLTGIPTTIIWGMRDIAFREKELQTWVEALKPEKVIRLEDVGHYAHDEAPEVLAQELLRS